MSKARTLFSISFLILSIFCLSACFTDHSKPGWTYMPDMAYPVAYEAYTGNPNFADGMTSRQPVKGTIPMYQGVMGNASNFAPYPYSNTPSGYDSAGLYVHSPITATPATMQEGERLFTIYCAVCHGLSGKANGTIVVNDQLHHPFPPPPSYFSDNLLKLPEGKMFHTVHYGKNLMGSYASQVDQKQAWMIIGYVRSMQKHYMDSLSAAGGYPKTGGADAAAESNTTSAGKTGGGNTPNTNATNQNNGGNQTNK